MKLFEIRPDKMVKVTKYKTEDTVKIEVEECDDKKSAKLNKLLENNIPKDLIGEAVEYLLIKYMLLEDIKTLNITGNRELYNEYDDPNMLSNQSFKFSEESEKWEI